jgi:hypothetical protein
MLCHIVIIKLECIRESYQDLTFVIQIETVKLLDISPLQKSIRLPTAKSV